MFKQQPPRRRPDTTVVIALVALAVGYLAVAAGWLIELAR